MEVPSLEKAKIDENGTVDNKKESKFEYWESLPLELRCMIAKETDVVTRFSLMFSSKSNYQIARSVPIKIESITIGDWVSNTLEIDLYEPNIFIHFKKYDPSEIITTVCFEFHEDGTLVHRFWKENDVVYAENAMLFLENTRYYDASMAFMEKLMSLTDYQMDEFENEVEDWGENSVLLDKLRIKKKLCISSCDGRTFNRWMNTAISPLEKLEIEIPKIPPPSNIDQFDLNHETIKNAKELKLIIKTRFLEKFDFLTLKCDKFDINTPDVRGETVNEFIKKWINGDVPDNFQRASFTSSKFRNAGGDIESSLDGLNYIPWRDEFRVDNKMLSKCVKFNKRHSVCYYIETKKGNNGAALILKSSGAVFLVTGKQKSIE